MVLKKDRLYNTIGIFCIVYGFLCLMFWIYFSAYASVGNSIELIRLLKDDFGDIFQETFMSISRICAHVPIYFGLLSDIIFTIPSILYVIMGLVLFLKKRNIYWVIPLLIYDLFRNVSYILIFLSGSPMIHSNAIYFPYKPNLIDEMQKITTFVITPIEVFIIVFILWNRRLFMKSHPQE